jgi:hypothetical protein
LTNQNPGDYWIGFANGDENSLVFTNVDATLLPSATYKFSIADFVIITNGYTETYETNVNIPSDAWPKYPQPQWGLINTNNIQVVMIDDTTDRAIDYVQFIGPSKGRDLMREITDANKKNYSDFWRTGGATSAVLNITIPSGLHTQLDASQIYNSALWSGQNKIQVEKQIDGFRKFIHLSSLYGNGTDLYGSTNLEIQVPYTPTAVTIDYTTWQANDPLVHYLASDLRFATEPAGGTLTNGINQWTSTNVPPPPNVGKLNDRYEPWGLNTSIQNDPLSDHNAFNIAYKDSLATNSDAWDFPTDKFPAIGWLGRVHRGTPWQTVFLKATNLFDYVETNTAEQVIAGTNTWKNITGNTKSFDAINAMPFQDRLLFDLFTTSPNDNSMRGQLSVNVSANSHEPDAALAAWSALFSGMVVLTNDPVTGTLSWTNIQPAGLDGLNSTLGQVVKGIYDTRTNFVNSDGLKGVFEHVGDILAVPQFSEKSPFVNTSAQDPNGNPIYPNDEVLEWLPQRAMSLLRVSSAPRYALYCYGQTLKPAQNSLSTSSTTLADGRNAFGMCTNYQVVSETAVRVLVHVEDEKTSHPRIVVDSYNVLPPD